MSINSTQIYSLLGNQSSIIPLAVKDCFSCVGMTAGSYVTGKEEGMDRFIDEFGTEIIWLGGLPVYKWLYDKTIIKSLGFDDSFDARNLKNKEILKKTKEYAPSNEIKAAIENIEKKQGLYKKLAASKFVVSTVLSILTYIGLTKLKQKYTEKQIKKHLIKEYKNKNNSINQSNEKKSVENTPTPVFKGAGKFIEQLAYNPIKNMWIVDGAITTERLSDSRNPQELVGYAIKEAYSLCFLYYVGGKVQDLIEKNAIKKYNRNISLDSRIIEDSYLKQIFDNSSIQNSLEQFNKIKMNSNGKKDIVELYDFVHQNPENAIVKIAKKSNVIKCFKNTDKIDSRAYLDIDSIENIHKNITQLYEQYSNSLKKGESSSKFFNDLKKIKRKSIRTNFFVSIFALGILAPATMLLKRKFFDKDAEFQTKKEIRDNLVREGLIV